MVGCDQRVEESIVDFGVEDRDALPIVGWGVGVGSGDPFDQTFSA